VDGGEDAPTLGLLLVEPFQLCVDGAVPMVGPWRLADLQARLGARLIVVAGSEQE
jgi:hypothetical protein